MKKVYNSPKVEITVISNSDVITLSNVSLGNLKEITDKVGASVSLDF